MTGITGVNGTLARSHVEMEQCLGQGRVTDPIAVALQKNQLHAIPTDAQVVMFSFFPSN